MPCKDHSSEETKVILNRVINLVPQVTLESVDDQAACFIFLESQPSVSAGTPFSAQSFLALCQS